MKGASKVLLAALLMWTAVSVAHAEDTQDSPLYAYTLRTTLERMEQEAGQTVLQEQSAPEIGKLAPDVILAQAATSQPIGPTVCNRVRTTCPQRTTACPPQVPTTCPAQTTLCPAYNTMCPFNHTTCPARSTRCPAAATQCPLVPTQCPARDTACPPDVPTTCPRKTTECPQYATMCPANDTTCPARSTRCPGGATQCPLVRTQCPANMTACPQSVPTACPRKTTECPINQTVCPGGATNCPVANTQCPVLGTMCPPNCPPGGALIVINTPTGDPAINASAEFAFDANTPGVCSILVQLGVNAPGRTNIANELRVSITTVAGSVLTWQTISGVPSPWTGSPLGQAAGVSPLMGRAQMINNVWQVRAIFTGMPSQNAAFGPKTVYAQIVDVSGNVITTTAQNIEVFYDRTATNNPGTGVNAGPNWFYYWKTGNAVSGGAHEWRYLNVAGTFGNYVPGQAYITVANFAHQTNIGPLVYTKDDGMTTISVKGAPSAAAGRGPYCLAEIIANYGYRKFIYESYSTLITLAENPDEDDGDPYDDPDDEGMPNLIEPAAQLQGRNGVPLTTDPNDPDTYNVAAVLGAAYAAIGDLEVRGQAVELNPASQGLTVDPLLDWSSPGWNTVPQYP